jgi:hypothetical protein
MKVMHRLKGTKSEGGNETVGKCQELRKATQNLKL